MCTVTFYPNDDHNWILSTNRDELKSRKKAKPPFIQKSGELPYLAPVDGQAGGTWVGVNEAGIGLTIINNYQGNNPLLNHRTDAVSRGLIIPDLMSRNHLEDVNARMQQLKVARYNPFKLIGMQSQPWMIMEWSWDGQKYRTRSLPVEPAIWVSSGRDYDGVSDNRRKIFERFLESDPLPGVDAVRRLHSSGLPETGAYSIAMEQELVATVSNTIAEVNNGIARMHYHDGRPAESGTWTATTLPLRAGGL
ncbi:MAG: NRDE family protein [Balneolales bacterium]